jgi:hypothetical protein
VRLPRPPLAHRSDTAARDDPNVQPEPSDADNDDVLRYSFFASLAALAAAFAALFRR